SALHYGVAQVLDARGSFAEAAEHLRQANALSLAAWRKRGQGYDPAEHTRFVDQLLAAFTPSFFQRVRGFGLGTERPLFLVGLPRSGTTLTEQILASHSQVFGAGELRLARATFQALPQTVNRPEPFACLSELDRDSASRLAQSHLDQLH